VAERKSLIWTLLLASIIVMVSPASGSDYPFGSKVLPNQSDIGRPLFHLPAETTMAFWDIGTPGYDEEDPVYLHIGPSASGTTNANDVRLTFLDDMAAGSKVTFHDYDMNKPIKQMPSIISFLDLHGSRAYDLNDPVYLHHFDYSYHDDYENSANMMTGFSERLPYRGREISLPGLGFALFTDNYKLFISDKILDKRPRKVGEMRGLAIEVVRGLKADYYHVLGTWLIKIQPHERVEDGSSRDDSRWEDPSAQFIQTNDVRLSSMGELMAGTKVTNFDEDQNKLVSWPPLASFLGPATDTTKMGFFDVNGNGVYDYEDDVYLNVPAGVSKGLVTVNNVRLSGPIL
jgi:hypothetical protein